MSEHFSNTHDIQRRTSLSYLLDPRRPRSAAEQRFIHHGYFRAATVLTLMLYFVYCNPEYSYTYSALRRRWGWEGQEPMFPQYFKIQVGGKGEGLLPLPKTPTAAEGKPRDGEER